MDINAMKEALENLESELREMQLGSLLSNNGIEMYNLLQKKEYYLSSFLPKGLIVLISQYCDGYIIQCSTCQNEEFFYDLNSKEIKFRMKYNKYLHTWKHKQCVKKLIECKKCFRYFPINQLYSFCNLWYCMDCYQNVMDIYISNNNNNNDDNENNYKNDEYNQNGQYNYSIDASNTIMNNNDDDNSDDIDQDSELADIYHRYYSTSTYDD